MSFQSSCFRRSHRPHCGMESLEHRDLLSAVPVLLGNFGGNDVSSPVHFNSEQRIAYFSSSDGTLWRSAENSPGVTPLAKFSRPVSEFAVVDADTWFSTYDGSSLDWLWRTDGTPAGTRAVSASPAVSGTPRDFQGLGATLFFTASGIYRTNGAPGGSSSISNSRLQDWDVFGDRLVFAVNPQLGEGDLLLSIGTERDSIPVFPFRNATVHELDVIDRRIFVAARDVSRPSSRDSLWVSDGTPLGTGLIRNFAGDLLLAEPIGPELFFFASDDADDLPYELWKSDGTAQGTVRVADLSTRPGNEGFYPVSLTAVADAAFFSDAKGRVWTSKGTDEGTIVVFSASAIGDWRTQHLIDGNGKAFFVRTDASQRRSSLWTSDGTIEGTRMVAQLEQTIEDLVPTADSLLILTARELWKLDLKTTISGTVWQDVDRDGIRDTAETGLPGITLTAVDSLGVRVAETLSDAAGHYFLPLPNGADYTIEIMGPAGSTITDFGGDNRFHPETRRSDPQSIAGADIERLDAGLIMPPISSTIMGMVWRESHPNGQPDLGEQPLSNVRVELLSDTMQALRNTFTGSDGGYAFGNLAPGEYYVRVAAPDGFLLGPGGEGLPGSQVNRATGLSARVSLRDAADIVRINSGIFAEILVPPARYEPNGSREMNRMLIDYLRITEIAPWEDEGYIELKNTSDVVLNLVGVRFINGIAFDFTQGHVTQIFPGEHLLLVQNEGRFREVHDTSLMIIAGQTLGMMRREGETLELVAPINDEIHRFEFDLDRWFPLAAAYPFSLTIVDERAPGGQWSDHRSWRLSTRQGGSPGWTDAPVVAPDAVVISEIMTNPSDGFNDWIELHNTTNGPIDVGGWWLGDDERARPRFLSYQIPAPLVIPAGGFLVLNRQDHFQFGLSSFGESLQLTAGDDQGLLGNSQLVRFPASQVDISFGRHVSSTGLVEMLPLRAPTRGAPNTDLRSAPAVITEIMYHPAFGQDGFVEIQNVSANIMDVQVISNQAFVAGFGGLQPGKTLLVIGIDPQDYRTKYSVPPEVEIVQGFREFLERSGSLEILVATPAGNTLRSDYVEYDSDAPWPEEADLGGASLERVGTHIIHGNDPRSWRVTDRLGGTPGVVAGGRVPGDSNGDGRFDSSDLILAFQAGEYEDGIVGNSTYAEGDWDGDGEFGTADLVLAFQTGGYSSSVHGRRVRSNFEARPSVVAGAMAHRMMRDGRVTVAVSLSPPSGQV